MDITSDIRTAIEAIVMVSDTPVDPGLLAQLLEIPKTEVEDLCAALAAEYDAEGRGFVLARVAGGYRYQTHPDTAPYVERFVLEGQSSRLSAAALETLAIVAYKQPISRMQVAAIRGVNVDGVVRTLQQRGYIDEVARDPGPGNAVLFGTTPLFLERVGLDSTDDLPPLTDFVPGADVVEALEEGLRPEPLDETPRPPDAPPTGPESETVDDPDVHASGSAADTPGPEAGDAGDVGDVGDPGPEAGDTDTDTDTESSTSDEQPDVADAPVATGTSAWVTADAVDDSGAVAFAGAVDLTDLTNLTEVGPDAAEDPALDRDEIIDLTVVDNGDDLAPDGPADPDDEVIDLTEPAPAGAVSVAPAPAVRDGAQAPRPKAEPIVEITRPVPERRPDERGAPAAPSAAAVEVPPPFRSAPGRRGAGDAESMGPAVGSDHEGGNDGHRSSPPSP